MADRTRRGGEKRANKELNSKEDKEYKDKVARAIDSQDADALRKLLEDDKSRRVLSSRVRKQAYALTERPRVFHSHATSISPKQGAVEAEIAADDSSGSSKGKPPTKRAKQLGGATTTRYEEIRFVVPNGVEAGGVVPVTASDGTEHSVTVPANWTRGPSSIEVPIAQHMDTEKDDGEESESTDTQAGELPERATVVADNLAQEEETREQEWPELQP